MNINEFGQFEMTNTQTEKAVGGTQIRNRAIRSLTAAPAIISIIPIHQVPEGATVLQMQTLYEAQEIGTLQLPTFNTLANEENMIKDVTVNW